MQKHLVALSFALIAGCSSPDRPGSIEYLPELKHEMLDVPPELVYVRLNDAFTKCFGNSDQVSVFENQREKFHEIAVVGANLSLGYTEMLKATVSPGKGGATRVSYSWQNAFWERYVPRMQGWARGEFSGCD
jgi:hypothetical protein